METSKENSKFIKWVIFISVFISFGISLVNAGELMAFLCIFVLYGIAKTIYGMFNKNIDEDAFSKSTLRTWRWIVSLPVVLYLFFIGLYILLAYIMQNNLVQSDAILEILEEILYDLEGDELGPVIACVGVGFYAISAIVCLCKKLFKEFLILHLVMPLTGLLVYITEDIEYFIEDTELLVIIPIVFVVAFITCIYRKEYKKAAISLLCCTLSIPLMILMFQILELLLDYLSRIYEWLYIYI